MSVVFYLFSNIFSFLLYFKFTHVSLLVGLIFLIKFLVELLSSSYHKFLNFLRLLSSTIRFEGFTFKF